MLVATLITIILCIVFAVSIAFDSSNEGSEPAFSFDTVAPLSIQRNVVELAAWSAHALTVVLASVGLILFIHGTGIRSNDLRAAHPSIYFNLTLPVSRTRLVVTRFLMSALCALGLMSLLLLANAAVLLIAGYPVPFSEMAQTSLFGCLFLVTAVWILDLAAIYSEMLSAWLIPLAAAVFVAIGASNVMHMIAGQPFNFGAIIAFVAIAALALALAIVSAHARDF